ncbi:hypothetical protein jhhlp_004860 [Lomentospora prolificans]|uniref:Alpha-L-rhamnosidase C-terminal domain-containing protein n=1 Tax=Lomentospora prolificans TaxID=41688 RepID=A0A2N3N7V3_9PEZI|nr:hypothetical protein jhhlp_004860 [Lomentospora prolificans]
MANRSQTASALALRWGWFTDENERQTAAQTLREIIADNDYLVGTGFAGTPELAGALHSINAIDDFYRMSLRTRVPSWLYQIVQNATTTWERWDSLLTNGTINPGGMTSFNHYVFEVFAKDMHQFIGGRSAAELGWKSINVAPYPGGNIMSAEARFVSPCGEVKSRQWIESGNMQAEKHRDGFHLTVWDSPNTRAKVTMPRSEEVIEIGSGYYEFHDFTYAA